LKEKTWLAGESLTFPDFHFYELLDQSKILLPGFLEQFPSLVAYHDQFQRLPKIAEYLKSPRFKANPINNPMARLGAQ